MVYSTSVRKLVQTNIVITKVLGTKDLERQHCCRGPEDMILLSSYQRSVMARTHRGSTGKRHQSLASRRWFTEQEAERARTWDTGVCDNEGYFRHAANDARVHAFARLWRPLKRVRSYLRGPISAGSHPWLTQIPPCGLTTRTDGGQGRVTISQAVLRS